MNSLTKCEANRIGVSVVVPFFNEQGTTQELYESLTRVLTQCGPEYELIFVDDGSTDGTRESLLALQHRDPKVVFVDLHGNYGQTAALAAGFDQARGSVIISMDADLQHDPEDLPRFLAGIEAGYDLVSGWRKERIDPYWRRRLPSRLANALMAKLSGIQLHDFGTTYKAYRREIVQNIKLYGQFHRFIPALTLHLHPRILEIPISSGVRRYGSSNYNLTRTVTVFFDLIRIKFLTTYIARPLQIFGSAGFLFMTAGSGILAWLAGKKFLFQTHIFEEHSPLFLFGIMILISGTQLFSLGLLGEMLSKMYHESTSHKIYGLPTIHRKPAESEEPELPSNNEIS